MPRYHRVIRPLAVSVVAGLALAGALAGPAPAQPMKKLKVVTNWFAQPEQATVWAALQGGIYRKHGLDVEITAGTGPRIAFATRAGMGDETVPGVPGPAGRSHHRGDFRPGRRVPEPGFR